MYSTRIPVINEIWQKPYFKADSLMTLFLGEQHLSQPIYVDDDDDDDEPII